MSDAELSDVADDDDIVRRYENADDEVETRHVDSFDKEVKEHDEQDTAQRVEPPKKRKSTRKLFVLNSERLKGPKGVHTIEKLYEGFKFKGKGREKEDLDRVMKRMEYWAFRVFPKLDFDDFLSKCEVLGHKKDLQVHLKKYRLGMITADDEMDTNKDLIDDEEDDAIVLRTESELLAQINDDEFQKLFDETKKAAEPIS